MLVFTSLPLAEPVDVVGCRRRGSWSVPTARVLVSGGAFPRYARNLGVGEPLATASAMRATAISVHHHAVHASHVTMPVLPPSLSGSWSSDA